MIQVWVFWMRACEIIGAITALLIAGSAVSAAPLKVDSLDAVDPLIGTEEIAGLGANYGGLQPMAGVPFGSMNLVPMTRTNGIGRVSFCSNDRELIGFILTRQPAIWMGEWGAVRILLSKPQVLESVEAHPHLVTVRAGGRVYELTASSHVAYIRTDDESLGADFPETGETSERTTRTGADPKPHFRCDWVKRREGNVLKVAVSLLGPQQAAANFAELPDDFDAAVATVRKEWERLFSRVEIEAPADVKTIFCTALYHSLLYPREMTEGGRHYSGIDDNVHEGPGYDCFSLWDTYRAEHPLLTLLVPERVDGMMQSLVNDYRAGGWLPLWKNLGYTGQMIGGPAEVVLAEAYVKGFRGFDAEMAYAAAKKNATVPQVNDLAYRWPPLMENPPGPPETRGGLTRYQTNGYVSQEETDESVSRTLDYAYDDSAVAAFAQALGKTADAELFRSRAKSYTNVWCASRGLFWPRQVNGAWCDSPDGAYTETVPTTARWCVPHDINGLVALMGGKDAFVRELDKFFATDFWQTDGIGMSVHGNETVHHLAYMYNRVGEYDRTCRAVRSILGRCYSTGRHGFDGNDDCGQMSAWYVLSALGIYPIDPASGEYEIGSPVVRSAKIRLGVPYNPTTLTIRVENYAPERVLVAHVRFNGSELVDRRIAHEELIKGGEMVFEMKEE